jgi:hypothetical protein
MINLIIAVILFVIGVAFLLTLRNRTNTRCPDKITEYKYISQSDLDNQFSKGNFPSEIYQDMFNTNPTFDNRYRLDYGKTYTVDNTQNYIEYRTREDKSRQE